MKLFTVQLNEHQMRLISSALAAIPQDIAEEFVSNQNEFPHCDPTKLMAKFFNVVVNEEESPTLHRFCI